MRRVLFNTIFSILLTSSFSWGDDLKANVKQPLPFEQKIDSIMKSIDYSGLQVFSRSNVSLNIDFKNKKWSLSNIHQFDDQGRLLLEQGRYGLCADLATYVYQEIKSGLSDQFEIRFASTTEKAYFPNSESNHIVLLLLDKKDGKLYLIDPSFKRYGVLNEFDQYKIFGTQESLNFFKNKDVDATYSVNEARPLTIKNELLLSFSVLSVDGKFDQDNYAITLSLTRSDRNGDLNLVIIGKSNGQIESFENKQLLKEFLSDQEIMYIREKMVIFLSQH